MLLLPAPIVAGLLPEPFTAAAERMVRTLAAPGTAITVQPDYPYWTGQGSVPVMKITVRHETGEQREAIPNGPRNHWTLKDVRDFIEYYNSRVQSRLDERARSDARQAAAEELRRYQDAAKRARYAAWFEMRAQPVSAYRKSSKVIDETGRVFQVVRKSPFEVAAVMMDKSLSQVFQVEADMKFAPFTKDVQTMWGI